MATCTRALQALTLLLLTVHAVEAWITLQDVSSAAGIKYAMGPKTKYGGPSIADLDGDGYQDMVFIHHDSYFIEVYFSKGNGTFSRQLLTWTDAHAISPFRYNPQDRTMHFSLSQGGSNGNIPKPIDMFKTLVDKTWRNVSLNAGITQSTRGRGRTALFMSLRMSRTKPLTDVLVFNARNPNYTPQHQQGLASVGSGKFESRSLINFDTEPNWYGAVTDFDGDGQMDVLCYEDLRVYKVTNFFQLTDLTSQVLPTGLAVHGTVSIAELDFDNDGLWDLYVCRTRTGDLSWLPSNVPYTDILLRNVGGRYVDVTKEAGIPQDGMSRGVTVGDFDNDGFIDMLIVKWSGPNLFLRNSGNGTFVVHKDVPYRHGGAPGDMAQAFDYDRNGALDVVMSEGHTHDKAIGGYYRLFKNNLSPVASGNNYLLVRVGSSPPLTSTSLYAVVTVFAGGIRMMRRVGPAGVAVSPSYIELLHFGLGNRTVNKVEVRWLDGAVQTFNNVALNSMITVGTFV